MIVKEDYNVKVYSWKFERMGKFEATFRSGKLSKLEFRQLAGSVSHGDLETGVLAYLRAIHKALSELFDHLDKKRL